MLVCSWKQFLLLLLETTCLGLKGNMQEQCYVFRFVVVGNYLFRFRFVVGNNLVCC
jgi:hypothetical protein